MMRLWQASSSATRVGSHKFGLAVRGLALVSAIALLMTLTGTARAVDPSPGLQLIADMNNEPLPHGGGMPLARLAGGGLLLSALDSVEGGHLYHRFASGQLVQLAAAEASADLDGSFSSARVGGRLFFSAFSAGSGAEPWVTDGTASGTYQLTDLVPGAESSGPKDFTVLGKRVYFTAKDASGTRKVFRVTAGSPSSAKPFLESKTGEIVAYRGHLYLSTGLDYDPELWVSDGTVKGTRRLKDIFPGGAGSDPRNFIAHRGHLYFTAYDDYHSEQIWRTDGTSAGTKRVANLGLRADPSGLTSAGDFIFFSRKGSKGVEPWRTDGTSAGTRLLRDIAPAGWSSDPFDFTDLDGTAFFVADDAEDGPQRPQLWKSDGTRSGTTRVAPDASVLVLDGYMPLTAVAASGRLFFPGLDDDGLELWTTRGTASSTKQVRDIHTEESGLVPIPNRGVPIGQRLYFHARDRQAGGALWVTDGTRAGTETATDLNDWTLGCECGPGIAGAGGMFFPIGSYDGHVLWWTDGSVVRSVHETTYQSGAAVALGDVLLFKGGDSTNGQELWRSDGTAEGTLLVKDIRPGTESSCRTEGNPPWCTPRLDLYEAAVLDGVAYFVTNDGEHGDELWRTDGTAGGTYLVKDINASGSAFGPRLTQLQVLGDELVFIASDGVNGYRLWRSDGTSVGTRIASLTVPAATQPEPYGDIAVFDGDVYFAGVDADHGAELRRWDPALDQITLVKEIAEGSISSAPGDLVAAAGEVFFVAGTPEHHRELWRSDGTAEGTHLVKDLLPGEWGSGIRQMTPFADGVLLSASANHVSVDAWFSDGTAEGTFRLTDEASGHLGGRGADFTPMGSRAFFTRLVEGAGWELWVTDGSVEGTHEVVDLNPGPGDGVSSLVANGSKLFFRGNDRRHGVEPWVADTTLIP